MTKLLSMEKLSEAFEWDDRLGDLSLAKCRLEKGGNVCIEIMAPMFRSSREVITRSEAPYVFDAIERYLTEIEDSLSAGIRALGLEPTVRQPETYNDDSEAA